MNSKLVYKIGLFDSGIGGFSVLSELFNLFPEGDYYYYSDDQFAPYGLKSDEFITERSIKISAELLSLGVELIVVACNTATASSIDLLREKFTDIPFVGVEPYLKAYYQLEEGKVFKLMVLTTDSTGKSERFKRLKQRLDPDSKIDHYSLKNLARLIEEYYYHLNRDQDYEKKFQEQFEQELSFLKPYHYDYAILGCTHYPLIKNKIAHFLNLKTISPCPYVAQRAIDLLHLKKPKGKMASDLPLDYFHFYSSTQNKWINQQRESLLGPFKGS